MEHSALSCNHKEHSTPVTPFCAPLVCIQTGTYLFTRTATLRHVHGHQHTYTRRDSIKIKDSINLTELNSAGSVNVAETFLSLFCEHSQN